MESSADFAKQNELLEHLEQSALKTNTPLVALPAKDSLIVMTGESVDKYFDKDIYVEHSINAMKLNNTEQYLLDVNKSYMDEFAKLKQQEKSGDSWTKENASNTIKALKKQETEVVNEANMGYSLNHRLTKQSEKKLFKSFAHKTMKDGITKVKAFSVDNILKAFKDNKFDLYNCQIKK